MLLTDSFLEHTEANAVVSAAVASTLMHANQGVSVKYTLFPFGTPVALLIVGVAGPQLYGLACLKGPVTRIATQSTG